MKHVSTMSVSKPFLLRVMLYLCVFIAAGMLLSTRSAHAVTPTWEVRDVSLAPDGTGRVLWIKSGTTSNTGVYSGDTISVWSLDATGKATAMGPSYGPFAGWTANDLVGNTSGVSYVRWSKAGTYSGSTYSGDTISLWTFNAAGKATAMGPSYGPYAGWRASYFQNVDDGTLRLYWTKSGTTDTNGSYSGDSISVWTINAATATATSEGTTYTLGVGWHTGAFVATPDGATHFIWRKLGQTNSNGVNAGDTVTLWNLDSKGTKTTSGPNYGPYTGWHASYAQPIGDGTFRLTWVKDATEVNGVDTTGESLSVYNLNANGVATSAGPAYSIGAGWSPNEVFATPDGTTHVLWIKSGTTNNAGTYSGDTASVWTLNATGTKTSAGPNYGPFAGWYADSGGIAPDGTGRLHWQKHGTYSASGYSGDSISIWSLTATGVETSMGKTYGPYAGWQSDNFDTISNTLTYQIWVHINTTNYLQDEFNVWSMNSAGTQAAVGPTYGPY